MPSSYEQPDFASLCTKTQHLKKDFYRLAECFLLFSKKERDQTMSWLELRDEVASLQNKYTAAVAEIAKAQSYFSWGCRLFGSVVSSVGLSPTDRSGQIAAIVDLIPLLGSRETQASVDDHLRTYILLGALFYRLLRIKGDYASLEEAIAQSALCRAIYQILGLSPKNKLDDWTIMKGCQLFYEFIKKDDTAARVSYIQEDSKFFEKLEGIIAKHNVLAQPMIDQLAYIDFVQSVAKTLQEFNHHLFSALDRLVSAKPPTVCQSPKAILDHVETRQDLAPYYHAFLKLVIAPDETVFSSDDVRSCDPKSLAEAVAQIKQRIILRNEYALLGAYLSVLMRASSGAWPDKQMQQDKKILYGLCHATIETAETGQLNYEARDFSLECLSDFVKLPDIGHAIDLTCWEHTSYLQREIEQERFALAPWLAREREQREAHSVEQASSYVA